MTLRLSCSSQNPVVLLTDRGARQYVVMDLLYGAGVVRWLRSVVLFVALSFVFVAKFRVVLGCCAAVLT